MRFSRTVLHNVYERTYFPASGWESRWVTVGTAVALLLLTLPFAFQLCKRNEPSEETGLVRLLQSVVWCPEQLLFFIAVGLLTVLLAIEMRHGMVTLSWGMEGVAVFVLALWLGERNFRLTGLGLLAAVIGHEIEHVDHYHCTERVQREQALCKIPLGGLVALPFRVDFGRYL